MVYRFFAVALLQHLQLRSCAAGRSGRNAVHCDGGFKDAADSYVINLTVKVNRHDSQITAVAGDSAKRDTGGIADR